MTCAQKFRAVADAKTGLELAFKYIPHPHETMATRPSNLAGKTFNSSSKLKPHPALAKCWRACGRGLNCRDLIVVNEQKRLEVLRTGRAVFGLFCRGMDGLALPACLAGGEGRGYCPVVENSRSRESR